MVVHKILEWSEDLDLRKFYIESASRGFVNNSSQKRMIDTFKNEREWNAWILYKDSDAIGSVVAHSFDEVMGTKTYRVLVRTCTFGEYGNKSLIKPKKLIAEHQNLTDQFLLPVCLEWSKGRTFATSNDSKVASQRLVHKYYFPTLEKMGIVKNIKDVFYRNTNQTVWEIFPEKFLENLNKYPRWQ